MKTYFAYIRVSTVKQGQYGSSLQEQKAAIEAFASRLGFSISEWFEDRETAAKNGRTNFLRMMARLEKRKAAGVLLHKIDRGARNLWDWARIQGLLDAGVEVHFVHDNLDMTSRGGRLAADIQAVVAADYVRNLRDEVRKGMRGRFRQGLYPLKAPLGYLDNGGGKPKTIDPIKGPLVRQAFELYSSQRYSYRTLRLELHRRGLTRRNGTPLNLTSITSILRNPFYAGIIKVHATKESFPGIHEPLISASLFQRIQDILDGKTISVGRRHDYLYRRFIKCKHCRTTLVGERQKGSVYYRCHTARCPTKCVREDAVSAHIVSETQCLQFTDAEIRELKPFIAQVDADRAKSLKDGLQSARLRVSGIEERQSRLTDAYVDQAIDRQTYEGRKASLLLELAEARERQRLVQQEEGGFALSAARFFEFAKTFDCDEIAKDIRLFRDALCSATSNWTADGKNLCVTMQSPFKELISELSVLSGGPHRNTPRTMAQDCTDDRAKRRHSTAYYRQVVRILEKHLKEWKPPVSFLAAERARQQQRPRANLLHQHPDDDLREAA